MSERFSLVGRESELQRTADGMHRNDLTPRERPAVTVEYGRSMAEVYPSRQARLVYTHL